MIKLQKINKSFETVNGLRQVLKDVTFEIPEGKLTVIGGENGSGKSVLMSIIAGLEEQDSGEIICDQKPGLVFQEAETQILGETPFEDAAYGPENLGWKKDKVNQAVKNALEKTGLSEKADFPARFLSGGEKRRLAVACMLAMDLPFLILDEPYANLDYTGVKTLNSLISELKAQKKTIVLLTHEIEKCLGFADNFVVLYKGQICFNGSPEEALKQNLEQWNIKNPLGAYSSLKDLLWL